MSSYGLDWAKVEKIIDLALEEDVGKGDLTTELLFPKTIECNAEIRCKESGILAGLPVANEVFRKLDSSVEFLNSKSDGDKMTAGDLIVNIRGSQKYILTGERLALNILQRLSGIATATSKYVKAVEGYDVKIIDTRKTVPGMRILSKYAVRVGGGYNHRIGLSDGILIKDNHIKLAGGIKQAVEKIKQNLNSGHKIEVETSRLDQVEQSLEAGADIIMLDNMPDSLMKEAVCIIGGKALIEASGGITLERVRQVAELGVNLISVGALTHSAQALDISLDMV